ncbi:GCN5-related N-acetyltransferase protein [Halorhabdus tiamatea SARL4B]|uniref:GCN5-related N-acetyltransferase protein n=1 Tax=Halorhabdus tiamatea SARL4B TaxID=1033806 RepID=U2E0L3_9EURY|nr:GNAT family N-acetyltransferase [Halorhabdus tiamatea]ERJ05893.1 GCN5-related N-acetyltransferase protein [Halorhabdus tiamatea SARL4B]
MSGASTGWRSGRRGPIPTTCRVTPTSGGIEETYLRGDGEFLVAERDGRIVACGGLLIAGETAELVRIAVDPAHQRSGYGTAILDGLEATAAERGCDRVVLTTADRQAAAKQFYADRGYERRDTRQVGSYELIAFEKSLDAV